MPQQGVFKYMLTEGGTKGGDEALSSLKEKKQVGSGEIRLSESTLAANLITCITGSWVLRNLGTTWGPGTVTH